MKPATGLLHVLALIICFSAMLMSEARAQTNGQAITVESGSGTGTMLFRTSIGEIYIEAVPSAQLAHLTKAGAIQTKIDQLTAELDELKRQQRERRNYSLGVRQSNLQTTINDYKADLRELRKSEALHNMVAINTGRTYGGKQVWKYLGPVAPAPAKKKRA